MRTAQIRRLLQDLEAVLAKEPPGPTRERIKERVAALRREINARA